MAIAQRYTTGINMRRWKKPQLSGTKLAPALVELAAEEGVDVDEVVQVMRTKGVSALDALIALIAN